MAELELLGLAHGAVDMVHLEGLEEPQGLHVLALARLAHPGLEQPAQRGERLRQFPALERRRLIEGSDLPLQERQEVQRVEDHVGLLVGPPMPRDDVGPGADHDLADIAADLDLVMGIGDRHRVVVAAVAHHRDRGGARADLLAGVVGRGRQHHQSIEVSEQPLADRLGMPSEHGVLAFEALRRSAPRSS